MIEIARELLELVLQGADCDSVWDAFQGGNDDGDEPDTTNKPEDVEMIDDLLDEMVWFLDLFCMSCGSKQTDKRINLLYAKHYPLFDYTIYVYDIQCTLYMGNPILHSLSF